MLSGKWALVVHYVLVLLVFSSLSSNPILPFLFRSRDSLTLCAAHKLFKFDG